MSGTDPPRGWRPQPSRDDTPEALTGPEIISVLSQAFPSGPQPDYGISQTTQLYQPNIPHPVTMGPEATITRNEDDHVPLLDDMYKFTLETIFPVDRPQRAL